MSESHYVIRIPKRWFQLSLGVLLVLWLIFGVGLGLVGKKLQKPQNAVIYQKSYYVADLVVPPSAGKTGAVLADFAPLITSITTQVAPTTWEKSGGTGDVESFATNLSLVISQTEDVHKDIAKYLAERRKAILVQPPSITEAIVPAGG